MNQVFGPESQIPIQNEVVKTAGTIPHPKLATSGVYTFSR
jgi:hypothetical protein